MCRDISNFFANFVLMDSIYIYAKPFSNSPCIGYIIIFFFLYFAIHILPKIKLVTLLKHTQLYRHAELRMRDDRVLVLSETDDVQSSCPSNADGVLKKKISRTSLAVKIEIPQTNLFHRYLFNIIII